MINIIKTRGEIFYNLKDVCELLGKDYDKVANESISKLDNNGGNLEYVYYKDEPYISYCGLWLLFKSRVLQDHLRGYLTRR